MCCSSPRRQRIGTGAFTRRACTPASSGPRRTRSALSCACSAPAKPRRAQSPICKACPSMPTRSAPSSTSSAARRGVFPTTGARGHWRPMSQAKQVEDAARAIDEGIPPFGVDLDTLSLSSRGVVLFRVRQDRKRDPRERAGGGRAKRHLGLHAVVVQPGQRNRQAIMGRSPSSGARDRRGMAPGARQQLPPRLERGALLADQGPHALRRQEPSSGRGTTFPILYSVVRGPAVGPVSDDAAETEQRPRSVTIVLTPEPLTQVDTAGFGRQPPLTSKKK